MTPPAALASQSSRSLSIACFGEALWDNLPRGLFLGGAPLNVGYHLSVHGIRVLPVTAVGRDFLGGEAERRMRTWGVDMRLVSRSGRPTGTVRATLDRKGAATYRIARNVAWDEIQVKVPTVGALRPAAVVFGTLALRSAGNRRTLEQLLSAWPGAVRVLDLNLRAPFDGPSVVRYALARAHVLKLNDEELARLGGVDSLAASQLERAVRRLSVAHQIPRVCVTAGAKGAGMLWDGSWRWEAARPVAVRDTIGAGDAFLAGLLVAWLGRRAEPAQALARACRVGEFVASRDGATPPYAVDAQGLPS